MSPLFGKRGGGGGWEVTVAGRTTGSSGDADPSHDDPKHLPRLVELGAALDDAVKQAAAMPLPALAAKLMNELFGAQYEPRGNGVDVDTIAGPLIPPNSGARLGDATPPGVDILWDMAAEAVQLLEQARLIVPDLWYNGGAVCFGFRSTRVGRTAVEQGTVEQLVTAHP